MRMAPGIFLKSIEWPPGYYPMQSRYTRKVAIPSPNLDAPQHVLAHREQVGVLRRPVEVHHRLDELRAQRVPLALVGGAALRHVVELGQEAVLLPDLVVVVHGLEPLRVVAHEAQQPRPEGLQRLEHRQRHRALLHRHPKVPAGEETGKLGRTLLGNGCEAV